MNVTICEAIDKNLNHIAHHREEIKSDFIRAYLAEQLPPGEGAEWCVKNVQLVETWSDDMRQVRWHFEARR